MSPFISCPTPVQLLSNSNLPPFHVKGLTRATARAVRPHLHTSFHTCTLHLHDLIEDRYLHLIKRASISNASPPGPAELPKSHTLWALWRRRSRGLTRVLTEKCFSLSLVTTTRLRRFSQARSGAFGTAASNCPGAGRARDGELSRTR